MQRRSRILRRQRGELFAQFLRRRHDGRTDRGRGVRAARDRAEWIIGRAQLELYFFHRQPDGIRADLREDGVGAGAEIVRGAADEGRAIGVHVDVRFRRPFFRGIGRGRDAPADEQIAIASSTAASAERRAQPNFSAPSS